MSVRKKRRTRKSGRNLQRKPSRSIIEEEGKYPEPVDERSQAPVETAQQERSELKEDGMNSETGIEDLDAVIGGGFPKGAVVLVSGGSGTGKTMFSFQWLFKGVQKGENGIYLTVTEPLFKTLKNLESLSFYNRRAIEYEKVRILDIRGLRRDSGFDAKEVLSFIEEQVKKYQAKRLCLDSITAIAYQLDDKAKIREFIFELGKMLAVLGCTSILTSEVPGGEGYSIYGVEEFISDAIIHFEQREQEGKMERSLQIVKMRGKRYSSEKILLSISEKGVSVFPPIKIPLTHNSSEHKISTGVAQLDRLFSGGIFRMSSTLITGSTGTGKSLFCLQFILGGLRKGEPALYVSFEESREQILRNADTFGWKLEDFEKKGLLSFYCAYPTAQFLDVHLARIKELTESKKVKRCAIDSLSAMSNIFDTKAVIRFAKKANGLLKLSGTTVFFTAATSSLVGGTQLSDSHLSTMTDNIIMLRYVEMNSSLQLVLNIVKVRGSAHSKTLTQYEIGRKGISIGQTLEGYEGIMTGVTRKVSFSIEEQIEQEFEKFIGPMGSSQFKSVKDAGLTPEAVLEYISGMEEQGILGGDAARKFKKRIQAIFHDQEPANESEDARSQVERKKKGFISRILGGEYDEEV